MSSTARLSIDQTRVEWLTVEDTARLLGISPKTVLRAYRGEGAYRDHPLKGYRPSRKVLRFTRADVDEWLLSTLTERRYLDAPRGTGRSRARRLAGVG